VALSATVYGKRQETKLFFEKMEGILVKRNLKAFYSDSLKIPGKCKREEEIKDTR